MFVMDMAAIFGIVQQRNVGAGIARSLAACAIVTTKWRLVTGRALAEQWTLSNIERLREPRPVDPHDRVTYIPACVFDGHHQPVERPRPAERQQVCTGLRYP